MAFQYDINKIFAELEQQAQKNKGQHDKADEKKKIILLNLQNMLSQHKKLLLLPQKQQKILMEEMKHLKK